MGRGDPAQDDCGSELLHDLAAGMAIFGTAFARWLNVRDPERTMSFSRMRLLYALHCGGPRMMSDLGQQLGVSARNVTALVDGLERDGQVRRVPHPTDRRATLIELSEGACDVARQHEAHLAMVAQLFTHLSMADQRALSRLVTKLNARLTKLDAAAAPQPVDGPPELASRRSSAGLSGR